MEVSVATLDGLKRQLEISVPDNSIVEKIDSRINELKATVWVDGFRPGKVPERVIRQKFGQAVREEILGKIVQNTLQEALTKENLMPANRPNVEIKQDNAGQDFVFTAELEVYPEIALGDFATLSVDRHAAEVKAEDIEKTLAEIASNQRNWQVVERASQDKDKVVFDFNGFVDGEALEGGQAEDFELELGSNSMIPGFEEQLIGKSAGDEFSIDVTFPDGYHKADLSNKPAKFDIKIKSVNEQKETPIDDSLAEKMGVEEGGLEALKTQIKDNMEREAEHVSREIFKQAVMDKLLDMHQLDLPESLVLEEKQRLHQDILSKFKNAGSSAALPEIPGDMFDGKAKKRVALGLLLSEIIKQKEIKLDDSRLHDMIEKLSKAYDNPERVAAWYYNNADQMAELKSVVMEEQIVDTVVEAATVNDKQVSYQELIELRKQGEKEENGDANE